MTKEYSAGFQSGSGGRTPFIPVPVGTEGQQESLRYLTPPKPVAFFTKVMGYSLVSLRDMGSEFCFGVVGRAIHNSPQQAILA